MKVLITGGSGLLGTAIAEYSIQNGFETYSGYNQHKAIRGTPIPLDITEKRVVEKVFEKIQPDAVVHSAAMTHVDRCEENKTQATSVNVEGTRNVAQEAKKIGAYFIYVSTDYVFSGDKGDYRELDDTNPINYYGLTKLQGEKIVSTMNADSCIVRPSVIYGSRHAAGKENFVLWVLNQLRKKEKVSVINDQWISPTLNSNLAEMIIEFLERKFVGVHHLSGATPINRFDFTLRIADLFEMDGDLLSPVSSSEMNWKAKRPRNSTLNVDKALKSLNHKPLDIHESLIRLKIEMENEGGNLR